MTNKPNYKLWTTLVLGLCLALVFGIVLVGGQEASIDGKGYKTFAKAFAASEADASPTTITLKKNVTTKEAIAPTEDLTIDLNGHDLTLGAPCKARQVNLTIIGAGRIYSLVDNALEVEAKATNTPGPVPTLSVGKDVTVSAKNPLRILNEEAKGYKLNIQGKMLATAENTNPTISVAPENQEIPTPAEAKVVEFKATTVPENKPVEWSIEAEPANPAITNDQGKVTIPAGYVGKITVTAQLKDRADIKQTRTIVVIEAGHAVNIEATTNGTVEADPKSDVSVGQEVKLTFKPAQDYVIDADKLKVLNAAGQEVTFELAQDKKTATFKMPASDVTVKATFKEKTTTPTTPKYNVTIEVPQHGFLTYSKTSDLAKGDLVKLTFTPAEGYKFENLIVKDADGASVNFELDQSKTAASFMMPASNVTVTVVFEQLKPDDQNPDPKPTNPTEKKGTIVAQFTTSDGEKIELKVSVPQAALDASSSLYARFYVKGDNDEEEITSYPDPENPNTYKLDPTPEQLKLMAKYGVYGKFYKDKERKEVIRDNSGNKIVSEPVKVKISDSGNKTPTEDDKKKPGNSGQSGKWGLGQRPSSVTPMGGQSSQLVSRGVSVAPAGPGNMFYVNAPAQQDASNAPAANTPVVANNIPQTGEKSYISLTLAAVLAAGLLLALRKKTH